MSEEAARDALRRSAPFNVIDLETGWKVDLTPRKRRPFRREEFERRVARELLGVRVQVCTAEDSILCKLEWAQLGGGSERQLRDVRAMVALRRGELDIEYVERWAAELGVEALWARVQG